MVTIFRERRFCICWVTSFIIYSWYQYLCRHLDKVHSFPVCVWVTQSCLTLCVPMDCSPPGSSVCGIFEARIQEWVAISSSRGSSQSKDQTHVSCITGRFFTVWTTREVSPTINFFNNTFHLFPLKSDHVVLLWSLILMSPCRYFF